LLVLWTLSATLLIQTEPAIAQSRSARALRGIRIERIATGWEINLEFEFAMRYLRHTPQVPGQTLLIQVDPLDLGGDPTPRTRLRELLPISRDEPTPLVEVAYDASSSGAKVVELRFSQSLAFSVRQGDGLQSLRILAEIPQAAASPESDDDRASQLLSRARDSIRDGELELAIALLTRILELPENEMQLQTRMDARELIGLTRERRGQLAHAQSEYESYLEDYPDGPAAARVRQRLDALLTASDLPRTPLRRPTKATALSEDSSGIRRDLFGSVAARYFRAETISEDGGGEFLATNIFGDLDVTGRLDADAWALRGDISATYDHDLGGQGRTDDTRFSRLSIQVEDRIHGLEATLGRQRRNDSGVLGRFDGLHVAADLGPQFTVSALAGMPVESTSDSKPDTDVFVASGAIDFTDLFIEGLEGQLFAVGQRVESLTDRAAIGGEIRFAGDKTYSFAYIDYDVSFGSLNTFLVSSSYRASPDTDFRILAERRNTPILTLRTALQGQPVEDIKELKKLLSDSEIRDLARDRTAVSWSGTAGITHRPNQRYQISGDLAVGYIESTKTSGGVEGVPANGPDVGGSLQLVVNDWLVEGGLGSVTVRYFEGETLRSFRASAYSRFTLPYAPRILPRVLWEFRDSDTLGMQSLLRPSLEVDWRYHDFLFDAEAGIEWVEPISGGRAFRAVSYFFQAGIRWEF
jgi:tetratricopeptide (TPR) repeat protein